MRFRNPFNPPPAPPAFADGKTLPEFGAFWLSRLVFSWVSPFLDVGFSRPLEKDDLWTLPNSHLSETITDQVEKNFYRRCPPQDRPKHLRDQFPDSEEGESSPTSSHTAEDDIEKKETSAHDKKSNGRYDSSLFFALHRTFLVRIWVGGVLKLCSDTLKTTTPLLSKVLLTWLTESYVWHRLTDEQRAGSSLQQPRGIGYGIGLAIALFAMQEVASLMANHYMQISMTNGLKIRTGIIGIIFRKSLRLSGRARLDHSVGKITTMISTDATRLDRFSFFGHNLWVSPIQLIIGVGLLIGNLGYSALVGLGVLILGFPIQLLLVQVMFKQRQKGVKITDTRVRLTNEVMQGIRLIKFYAWETFYAHQIGDLRGREIETIKVSAIARSALISTVTFIPILATVLSFITYALTGHDLNIAIIFSSLQFFNIIRYPLVFFPFVLSAFSDALVALRRISSFLTAEELPEPYAIEPERKYAIDVDGDFTWETAGKIEESKFNSGKPGAGKGRGGPGKKEKGKGKTKTSKDANVLPMTNAKGEETSGQSTPKLEEKPFELKNLRFTVPKGAFIAIVGRVGSGKSSVLQAIIGEMRKTRGDLTFGGNVAYVPQTAWIKNATLRDNILFGQPDDEDRFREVVRACNLEHDLEMFPNGELTEIGEKGINLSGGQKARVSLARAAYSHSDIVLLDDPLSAVDAYVGKAILENCLTNGPLADRTRILVTHALHVLDKTDYIYVMENGVIAEQGTFNSLMKDSVIFAKLMEEYGNSEKRREDGEESEDEESSEKKEDGNDKKGRGGAAKDSDDLMQAEERNTGSVEWSTYAAYLKYAGGVIWAPIILLLLAVTQAAQVSNNLFLGFWTSSELPGFSQGDYMGVYSALGVAQAILTFILSSAFALTNLRASLNLFKAALAAVLKSPVSFFDTTPIGRILSRLSKDQDTLDTELTMTLFQFMVTFSSVLGTIALVFYTFPYLGIIFAPMIVLYYLISSYYRRTSVETKRLDSVLRSTLYSAYTESLTGLSTIRAYRIQGRAIRDADYGLDMENRAYYMTIAIQRWLAVRLDMFANVLILGIGLFAAGFRESVNPAKIGVVLSYTLGITQQFSEMVSQFAQNEQNMNAVERVLHYAKLPSEGGTPTAEPPTDWPAKGGIVFKNVELAYREGLPSVLKGVSFEVRPGEKVGIVGRTGAGKSSLLQALFRMVEVKAGSIEIDGINIANLDLYTLRHRLALVPQDSILFLGTLRENLDPQNTRTDAEMISVLQRAWLLPKNGSSDPVAEAKFSLDSAVGDEGSNFSAGEKQLLALCRALVKNSQIIVLDEATSSVDVETDAKLQRTIQTEFSSATLLCIAHRLNTIAYYDRILVMNEGQVAEYDTVLNLFDKEDSIFRSLCNEANLTRADIVKIREQHDKQQTTSGSANDSSSNMPL